ncbi:KIF24, partial [Symbiodinium sp. CCMP2456]
MRLTRPAGCANFGGARRITLQPTTLWSLQSQRPRPKPSEGRSPARRGRPARPPAQGPSHPRRSAFGSNRSARSSGGWRNPHLASRGASHCSPDTCRGGLHARRWTWW